MSGQGDEGVALLVPYAGPTEEVDEQDVFVYLRPESNGMEVESTIFKVIENCPAYKNGISLVYMANLSGSWMMRHHVVERHYALKLYFATHGKDALTPGMRRGFEQWFSIPFQQAPVLGSFEALRRFGCSAEELFQTWVPRKDFCEVSGQTFKRVRDHFVVNYDIPALLHKNTAESDIAVMVFRISTGFDYFDELVGEMADALVKKDLLSSRSRESRVFHYSKSPFEQILDAQGHLVRKDGSTYDLEAISFARFLLDRGIDEEMIRHLVRQPLITVRENGQGEGESSLAEAERHLFAWTAGDNYEVAYRKLRRVRSQYNFDL
ncbi:MAG: hypothetical protein ACOCWS_03500 [Alkalispirochaetaceae bacterium]